MNIYCVIFMCTFGTNSTDTEIPRNNSLLEGSGGISSTRGNGTATTHADVAAMILPEKGDPVPHMGDIIMDLPNIRKDDATSFSAPINDDVMATLAANSGPTLSDILLPPSKLPTGAKANWKN